jgi:UDP:flavonoid glycosyltransferase YjiC (YdhE family)
METVAELPVRCIVATGGSGIAVPPNCIHSADFVSYSAAIAVASVAVSNGGAPSIYAALAHGKPTLGLPSNLDQIASLASMMRTGAVERLSSATYLRRWLSGTANGRQRLEQIARCARQAQTSIGQIDAPAAIDRWQRALLSNRFTPSQIVESDN